MPMPDQVPISVIIPCWQDEALLGQLLAQLHRLAQASRQVLQIIVVDAARSHSCRETCLRHGAQWLPASPCRGGQLRLGAGHARHSILWFLHADAQLQGNPLPELRAAIDAGAVGGYFAFRFSGKVCWQSRLLEQLIAWRNHFGVPYGDQGIFVEASAYHACGQHSPLPLFEEVELVKQLRRLGRFERIAHGLKVDPRRWQRDGWWRRSLHNRLLALAYFFGVPPTHLARRYNRANPTASIPANKP
jgi:rSAM/selenodomain-associated transferase 2